MIYVLSQSAWGKRYATEIAQLKKYAFEELGITRLIALIDPETVGSERVAQKGAYTSVGRYFGGFPLPKSVHCEGQGVDATVSGGCDTVADCEYILTSGKGAKASDDRPFALTTIGWTAIDINSKAFTTSVLRGCVARV